MVTSYNLLVISHHAGSILYQATQRYTREKQASCHPQCYESKGRAMMRRRPCLLKAQHFAEDEAWVLTDQPFRASSLQTALEVQTQDVGIANLARR
jgi:hypothetical protein